MNRQLAGKRILIVDEDEAALEALCDVLEQRGARVFLAVTGQGAVQKAPEQRLDLVVCNYDMPFLNGLEILRALRDCPATAHVRFLLYTDMAHPGLEADALLLQADAFLQEVSDLQEIVAAVPTLLARRLPAPGA